MSASAVFVYCILVFIPLFLGMLAVVELLTTTVPDETTASFIDHASDRYLDIVSNRYGNFHAAQVIAHEAAGNEAIEEYDTDSIATILGLNPEKTCVRKNGVFETTLDNGEVMTVSEKSICIDWVYLRLYPNGYITNVWKGYNNENETGIVLGGKKRTIEELATIAMVAHQAQDAKDGYHWVDMNGSKVGILCRIFAGYIILELGVLIVAFALSGSPRKK